MVAVSFASVADLVQAAGTELGPSRWWEVTQERIDRFADATDDHQWIHVDPARARNGPFGGPIAHGYLTLSLAVLLLGEIVTVDGASMVNHGTDRVRFPAPVPVGSRIRAVAALVSTSVVPGGVHAEFDVTLEVEGSDRPACVARILARYLE